MKKILLSSLLVAFMLSGCGGGESSSSASQTDTNKATIPSIMGSWTGSTLVAKFLPTFTISDVGDMSARGGGKFNYYYSNGDTCSCMRSTVGFIGTELEGVIVLDNCSTTSVVDDNKAFCSSLEGVGTYSRTDTFMSVALPNGELHKFTATGDYPTTLPQSSLGLKYGWLSSEDLSFIGSTNNRTSIGYTNAWQSHFVKYSKEADRCNCSTFELLGTETSGSVVRSGCTLADSSKNPVNCNLLNNTGTYTKENDRLSITYSTGEVVNYTPMFNTPFNLGFPR